MAEISTIGVVGAGTMGHGIAQVARSIGLPGSLGGHLPRGIRARDWQDRGQPDQAGLQGEALPRATWPRPSGGCPAGEDLDALSGVRSGDRGGGREARGQAAVLGRARRHLPAGDGPGHQHQLDLDHPPGGRDLAAREGDRHALHEPGAADEAGRDHPWPGHRPGDLRRGRGGDAAHGQDPGRGPRFARLRLQPRPDADDQRGDLLSHEGVGCGRGDRRGDEAGHEPPDGAAGAGRPDRARRLPRHPATCSTELRRSQVPAVPAAGQDGRRRASGPQDRDGASTTTVSATSSPSSCQCPCIARACGALNDPEDEFCAKCQQKLLVVSGGLAVEEVDFEEGDDDSVSFDEHLLERISVLEEAVRRTAETLQRLLAALNKQERNILINHTGLTALREVLDRRNVVGADEWRDLWKSQLDGQLLALEKRQSFAAIKDRVAGALPWSQAARLPADAGRRRVRAVCPRRDRGRCAPRVAFAMDKRNYELACFIGETYFNEGDARPALSYFGHASWSRSPTTTRDWSTAASSCTSRARRVWRRSS